MRISRNAPKNPCSSSLHPPPPLSYDKADFGSPFQPARPTRKGQTSRRNPFSRSCQKCPSWGEQKETNCQKCLALIAGSGQPVKRTSPSVQRRRNWSAVSGVQNGMGKRTGGATVQHATQQLDTLIYMRLWLRMAVLGQNKPYWRNS
jgi:hypothetical protein